ncbi:MAG: hypothetical protein RQ936_06105 [Gammaproteobacteria bacterium]|nr:hypothetical protein [Gammaproteobacteria bacterium]
MNFPDNYDPRIPALQVVAKDLLAENPESLPIYAVGCLLGDKENDHARIKNNIEALLKTARETPHLLNCLGNPNHRTETVPVMCGAGGFTVPGLTEEKVFSGADATITREDTKRLLVFMGQWPLQDSSLLRPWFVVSGAAAVSDDRFTEANYIREPERSNAVNRLLRQVINEFMDEGARIPAHTEVFQHIVKNVDKYDQVTKATSTHFEVRGAKVQTPKSIYAAYGNCFRKL